MFAKFLVSIFLFLKNIAISDRGQPFAPAMPSKLAGSNVVKGYPAVESPNDRR
jgi:hypothetical protein